MFHLVIPGDHWIFFCLVSTLQFNSNSILEPYVLLFVLFISFLCYHHEVFAKNKKRDRLLYKFSFFSFYCSFDFVICDGENLHNKFSSFDRSSVVCMSWLPCRYTDLGFGIRHSEAVTDRSREHSARSCSQHQAALPLLLWGGQDGQVLGFGAEQGMCLLLGTPASVLALLPTWVMCGESAVQVTVALIFDLHEKWTYVMMSIRPTIWLCV